MMSWTELEYWELFLFVLVMVSSCGGWFIRSYTNMIIMIDGLSVC